MIDDYIGFAVCEPDCFCAQPMSVCKQCEDRERLGCVVSKITIEQIETHINNKNGHLLDKLSNMNKTLKEVTKSTQKFKSNVRKLNTTLKKVGNIH